VLRLRRAPAAAAKKSVTAARKCPVSPHITNCNQERTIAN
jgi:hypothetical protein